VAWPNLGLGMLQCGIRATCSILSLHGPSNIVLKMKFHNLQFQGMYVTSLTKILNEIGETS